MPESLPHPLCTETDHWNEVIKLRYHQFLSAVTALALDNASRHLAVFSSLLTASVDFTDGQLDKFTDDDDQALQMIKADHLILCRSLVRAQQSLARLERAKQNDPQAARSVLVDMLDNFVRLKNILEHHVVRVQDSLFPHYHAVVNYDAGKNLAQQLCTAMQRAGIN